MRYRVKPDGSDHGCVNVILVFDQKQYVFNMTQEEFDELANKAICKALIHMHDFSDKLKKRLKVKGVGA